MPMRRITALGFAAALIIVGCQSKPSLVGDWTASQTTQNMTATTEWSFKDGGKMTMKTEAMGQKMTVEGDYTLEEKKLTMTPTKFDIPGLPAEVAKQLEKEKKPTSFTVEFKSADEVVISPEKGGAGPTGGQSMTLKRKKA